MEIEKFGVTILSDSEESKTNGGLLFFLGPVATAFGVIGAIAFAAGYAYEKLK